MFNFPRFNINCWMGRKNSSHASDVEEEEEEEVNQI